MAGIDGKTLLSFIERFELNEFLKLNYKNWIPNSFKKIILLEKNGKEKVVYVSTISDRVWQLLIKFSLDPLHEAVFHPNNVGFRLSVPYYMIQKLILLNLHNESFPLQKRIIFIDLTSSFSYLNPYYVLNKLKIFKSIKICLFRLFKKGFLLDTFSNFSPKLSDLLINIALDGIEDLNNIIRYGFFLLVFLNPFDNETHVINRIFSFFSLTGIDLSKIKFSFSSGTHKFDFLEWHFKFSQFSKVFISVPSFKNYNDFLKRLKYIVNNSNYGVNVKVQKLSPIIKDWKQFHKFSTLMASHFKLFSLKRKTLAVFNKEAKQDFYSSKRLVDKCFFYVNVLENRFFEKEVFKSSPFFGHFNFCIDQSQFLCIHCGVNLILFS